ATEKRRWRNGGAPWRNGRAICVPDTDSGQRSPGDRWLLWAARGPKGPSNTNSPVLFSECSKHQIEGKGGQGRPCGHVTRDFLMPQGLRAKKEHGHLAM